MKKFIQLSLVLILVIVLFQAVSGGSAVSPGNVGAHTATHISSPASTSVEGIQMAACLIHIAGVICVQPNVGWNS
jgi:glutamate synthase domain-containing protein 3